MRPVRRFSSVVLAATVTLATLPGRVLDTTTGQPLPGVRVTAGAASAKTDARGRFTLRRVRLGTQTLTLESNDVPLQRITVRVGARNAPRDLRACSTTLDFHCGGADGPAPAAGGGAG